ncbi:hypothetical protein Csa_023910, partial [Cucumis sativus]
NMSWIQRLNPGMDYKSRSASGRTDAFYVRNPAKIWWI